MAKNTIKKRREPSKSSRFEMLIRTEEDLNVTFRLLWLMTVMSYNKEHRTYMTEPEMARQLHTTEWQIQNSLKIILAIEPRLFRRLPPVIGVHRPNQYKRCILKGETPGDDFVWRVLTTVKMDICLGLHWAACKNVNLETGVATFSARKMWPVTDEALRQARIKMNRLPYIRVESSRESGKPASYTLNFNLVADEQVETKPVRKAAPTPTQRPARVKKEQINIHIQAARTKADEERSKAQALEQRRRGAWEAGVDLEGVSLPGVTAKSIESTLVKKPIRRFEIDVEDD